MVNTFPEGSTCFTTTVDGPVYPNVDQDGAGQTFLEPRIVYRNLGNGIFQAVSKEMGPGSPLGVQVFG